VAHGAGGSSLTRHGILRRGDLVAIQTTVVVALAADQGGERDGEGADTLTNRTAHATAWHAAAMNHGTKPSRAFRMPIHEPGCGLASDDGVWTDARRQPSLMPTTDRPIAVVLLYRKREQTTRSWLAPRGAQRPLNSLTTTRGGNGEVRTNRLHRCRAIRRCNKTRWERQITRLRTRSARRTSCGSLQQGRILGRLLEPR